MHHRVHRYLFFCRLRGKLLSGEWNYRPRIAIRRYAPSNNAGAETSDFLGPERFAINNSVRLKNDSLESATYTFMNLHPTVEGATTKAPLPDHESAVSAYD